MTPTIHWPFSAISECGDQEGHSRLPGSHLGSGTVVGGAVAGAFLAGLPPTLRTRNTSSVWLFCDLVVYSPPGSSIHGIFQARILECVAISSSRGSSRSKDQTHVSCVSCPGRWVLLHWRHLGSPTFRQGCFTLQWTAQRSDERLRSPGGQEDSNPYRSAQVWSCRWVPFSSGFSCKAFRLPDCLEFTWVSQLTLFS